MDYSNMDLDQLNHCKEKLLLEVETLVSGLHSEFIIFVTMHFNETVFTIKHKTMSRKNLMNIYVNASGKTSFDHNSNSWIDKDFTHEATLNMSIELFLIAKSIMQLNKRIIDIVNEDAKICVAISKIKNLNEKTKRDSAMDIFIDSLNSKYTKTNTAEILKLIRKNGHIRIVTAGAFDNKSGNFEENVICISDFNSDTYNSRLNLYRLQNFDKTIIEFNNYAYKEKINIRYLDRFNNNTYLFDQIEEEA